MGTYTGRTPLKYKLVFLFALLMLFGGIALAVTGGTNQDPGVRALGVMLAVAAVPVAVVNKFVLWLLHK